MRSKVKTHIMLLAVLLFASVSLVYAQVGGRYNLGWWTVDNGGGLVSGGTYELYSTTGQPDAYTGIASVGNKYTLQSGFWSPDYFRYDTFLPVVLKRPLPDLVGSFTLAPANPTAGDTVVVTAVITNQGLVPADAFWVDFYVNPTQTPTVNKRWNDLCADICKGLAWFIPAGLGPGQSVIVTSNDFTGAPGRFSIWDGSLTGATNLHLLVDSWNPTVATGGVFESNENNNLSSMTGLNISGLDVDSQSSGAAIAPRPAPASFNPELMVEPQSLLPATASTSTPIPLTATTLPPSATPLPDTPTATTTPVLVITVPQTQTAVIMTPTLVPTSPAVSTTATATATVEPALAAPETDDSEP